MTEIAPPHSSRAIPSRCLCQEGSRALRPCRRLDHSRIGLATLQYSMALMSFRLRLSFCIRQTGVFSSSLPPGLRIQDRGGDGGFLVTVSRPEVLGATQNAVSDCSRMIALFSRRQRLSERYSWLHTVLLRGHRADERSNAAFPSQHHRS